MQPNSWWLQPRSHNICLITGSSPFVMFIIYYRVVVSLFRSSRHLHAGFAPTVAAFCQAGAGACLIRVLDSSSCSATCGGETTEDAKTKGVTGKRRGWSRRFTAVERMSFVLKERKWHREGGEL